MPSEKAPGSPDVRAQMAQWSCWPLPGSADGRESANDRPPKLLGPRLLEECLAGFTFCHIQCCFAWAECGRGSNKPAVCGPRRGHRLPAPARSATQPPAHTGLGASGALGDGEASPSLSCPGAPGRLCPARPRHGFSPGFGGSGFVVSCKVLARKGARRVDKAHWMESAILNSEARDSVHGILGTPCFLHLSTPSWPLKLYNPPEPPEEKPPWSGGGAPSRRRP